MKERESRFDPRDPIDIARCIHAALNKNVTEAVEKHYSLLEKYRSDAVEKKMRKEYRWLLEGGCESETREEYT